MNRIKRSWVICAFILALITSSWNSFSQDTTIVHNYWTTNTAYTVSKNRLELSLFSASHMGLSNKLELSAHPLVFWVIPQANLKIQWSKTTRCAIATQHGFMYPTIFLRLLGKKDKNGFISTQYDMPQMFSIYNGVLFSYIPFHQAILTVNAGVAFSVRFGPLDPESTIDMPFIYPRLAVFYNSPEFYPVIDFRGNFNRMFGWVFSVENFIVTGTPYDYFMENKGALSYNSRKSNFRYEIGYKLCYGTYPSGKIWHILPDIELIFAFGK